LAAAEGKAPGRFSLPDLVFVDLEPPAAMRRFTASPRWASCDEDDRVIEEWSSLVNPECRIPAYIEAFTGITNEMVAGAPRFSDLAALVLTEAAVDHRNRDIRGAQRRSTIRS